MHKLSSALRLLYGLSLVACLTACTTMPGMQAVMDTYHLLHSESEPDAVRLDPRYQYLRVQTVGGVMYVALGNVEGAPDARVEVWYSPRREVLRLREGRIAGASLDSERSWSSVTFDKLPRWDQVGEGASFERRRDVRPGYLYGIREKMFVRRIPAPGDSQLRLIQPAALMWFEERAEGTDALPPSRYGVDMESSPPKVVYAEQCLFRDACFSWQRWGSGKENKH